MFIDIHGHTFSFNDPRSRKLTNLLGPEELIAAWPEWEIEQAVLLPIVHHECGIALQTNENVIDICNAFPGKFIFFCNLDPRYNHNSPATDFTPVLEHYQAMGCQGVGEMCASLAWDDPRMLNMLGHIEKAGLPLLFHVGLAEGTYGVVDEPGLPKLEYVLGKFPKLNFLGHSMAVWSAISGDVTADDWLGYPTGPVTEGGRLVELLRRYPNFHGDISAGSGNNALTRDPEFGYWFMEEFQDQLLYGSDLCWPDQQVPQTATLKNALAAGKISQAGFDNIGRGNAERMLGLL
ncbi:MAG: amidohydrolase family protein [Armatimonadota bacterium]